LIKILRIACKLCFYSDQLFNPENKIFKRFIEWTKSYIAQRDHIKILNRDEFENEVKWQQKEEAELEEREQELVRQQLIEKKSIYF